MINCNWMGVKLHSPIVLASLTLFSKPDLKKHLHYFQSAVDYGVGAIVLPSIHPLRRDETIGEPFVRTSKLFSGLKAGQDSMGFAVLGTTDNIVSIDYGINLAKEAVKLDAPIFGSVANIGTENDFLRVIDKLVAVDGLSGIELNFSCPNVLNGIELKIDLLDKVRSLCGSQFPVSIKLAPQYDYNFLLNYPKLFDSITLSNAYIGLIPPQITSYGMTFPFDDVKKWRPTGIYGPQEKFLTFYDIWKFKTNSRTNDFQLASVGGMVNEDDILKAILLGADCVQISSMVFWRGLSAIKNCNEKISEILYGRSLEEIKGTALDSIVASDVEMEGNRPFRKMRVNPDKCRTCIKCFCVERGCYAFNRSNRDTPTIDSKLCSGCGWCQKMCPFGAIDYSI